MNKIQKEVLDIYTSFKLEISSDFQNQADAKAVAAQLTLAYSLMTGTPGELFRNINTFNPPKGGLNG